LGTRRGEGGGEKCSLHGGGPQIGGGDSGKKHHGIKRAGDKHTTHFRKKQKTRLEQAHIPQCRGENSPHDDYSCPEKTDPGGNKQKTDFLRPKTFLLQPWSRIVGARFKSRLGLKRPVFIRKKILGEKVKLSWQVRKKGGSSDCQWGFNAQGSR